MTKLYIFIAVLFVVGFVIELLTSKRKLDRFPYQKRRILTEAEQEFYIELKELVADRFFIFPQVQYGAILKVTQNEQNWKTYFNRINQKSADFVLVDKQTFETKLVIELDDWTHSRSNRQTRDSFIDQALKSAGIAILHTKGHNLNEINKFLISI